MLEEQGISVGEKYIVGSLPKHFKDYCSRMSCSECISNETKPDEIELRDYLKNTNVRTSVSKMLSWRTVFPPTTKLRDICNLLVRCGKHAWISKSKRGVKLIRSSKVTHIR